MIESRHWGIFSFTFEGLLKTTSRRGEGAEGEKEAQEKEAALALPH